MAILNYTTQIKATKTIGEIQAILAKGKAQRVAVDYVSGEPSALTFMIIFFQQEVHFRLPCNVEGVYKSLCRSRAPRSLKTHDQARRVAWRIIKDWIEAQLAIVEAEQAQLAEVFLPYAVDNSGQTFFHRFTENHQKQLSA
jgi:hypothetical protein